MTNCDRLAIAAVVSSSILLLYTLFFPTRFFPERWKSCPENSNSNSNPKTEQRIDDARVKFLHFKQFDAVEETRCLDHYYKDQGLGSNHQPTTSWTKKILQEWTILRDNLPETIFVRTYESRMDLLRVAIIGADDTPYHDGLFFFDIMFPSSYPRDPPMVYYRSGGFRLNPNLFMRGEVCLSLLGTWTGYGTECWLPDKSTMLQVLVSIQALVLNSNPFFNESNYDGIHWGEAGRKRSKSYNEEVFILSLKTMMYSMRNQPKHFEDLVAGHFRIRALDILKACRVYSEGAEVGSDIEKMVKKEEKVVNKNSATFKSSLAKVVQTLADELIKNYRRTVNSLI